MQLYALNVTSIVITATITSVAVVAPVRNAAKVTAGVTTVITAVTAWKQFVSAVMVVLNVPMCVLTVLKNAETVQVIFALTAVNAKPVSVIPVGAIIVMFAVTV